LQQTVHWLGRAHVGGDFLEHTLLRPGRVKREDFLDGCTSAFEHAKLNAGCRFRLPPSQGQSRCDIEKLFKDQPHLRRRTKAGKIFDRLAAVREMGLAQGLGAIHQLVLAANRLGQPVGDTAVE